MSKIAHIKSACRNIRQAHDQQYPNPNYDIPAYASLITVGLPSSLTCRPCGCRSAAFSFHAAVLKAVLIRFQFRCLEVIFSHILLVPASTRPARCNFPDIAYCLRHRSYIYFIELYEKSQEHNAGFYSSVSDLFD